VGARYAFFMNSSGGILDDPMITRREDLFPDRQCRRKDADTPPRHPSATAARPAPPDRRRWRWGAAGREALARLNRVTTLTFMSGASRSPAPILHYAPGYTGEDGYEISVPGRGRGARARTVA
jgi:aminomethyltransferase